MCADSESDVELTVSPLAQDVDVLDCDPKVKRMPLLEYATGTALFIRSLTDSNALMLCVGCGENSLVCLVVCRAYKAKAAGLDYTRLGSMAQQVRYCCKENCKKAPNHRATKRINEINEQTTQRTTVLRGGVTALGRLGPSTHTMQLRLPQTGMRPYLCCADVFVFTMQRVDHGSPCCMTYRAL